MSVNASHTRHSLRFRRDLAALKRRGDAWLHDFQVAGARPESTNPAHPAELIAAGKPARQGRV